jgi:ketosteroid isomerase-like protein
MTNDSPIATVQTFLTRLATRDLEGLLALYEPDALFVPEPGVQVVGHAALRAAFLELFAIDPRLTLETTETLSAAELSFVSNRWSLRGVTQDGTAVERNGQSSIVLRCGPDGTYRIVIDRL